MWRQRVPWGRKQRALHLALSLSLSLFYFYFYRLEGEPQGTPVG